MKNSDKYIHLENSLKTVNMLEEKAAKSDYGFHTISVENREFEALEIYVIEVLMNGRERYFHV